MERPVLVAEDDPVDAWLLGRAFTKAGIDVRANFVRDGQEVLDYLAGKSGFSDRERHPFPDVLLLDLKMPRLNGFEVLQAMRKNPALRPACVVILTSSELTDDRELAQELGADHFVTKPTTGDYSGAVTNLREFWEERACFHY